MNTHKEENEKAKELLGVALDAKYTMQIDGLTVRVDRDKKTVYLSPRLASLEPKTLEDALLDASTHYERVCTNCGQVWWVRHQYHS